jgi:hypothetical protein
MTKRLGIAAVAVMLAVPVLASCGFDEQTDQDYTPTTGVHDRSGDVDVLDALIVSGTNGSGTVVAGLVNNDNSNADKLTGVTGAGEDQSVTVNLGSPIDIPAGGSYQLADKGQVTAKGDQVVPGHFVRITFTFDRAEAITVDVPVVAHSGDYASVPVP